MNIKQLSIASAFALVLAACAGTDNAPVPTPLETFASKIEFNTVWHASHASPGIYRFVPDSEGQTLFVGSAEKGIASYAIADGKQLNTIKTEEPIAGGLMADRGMVVAGTIKGRLYAFDQLSGAIKWKIQLSSEIVAPAASAEGTVVVRTVDGKITGLSMADGTQKWQYQARMPALILRSYAPVTIADGVVFAGLPGGKLTAISLADGRVLWEAAVAQPKGATELERVADVAAAPVANNGQICAAAYQGRVACFVAANGSQIWSRDLSSYAGIAMDRDKVYVTDDVGNVLAFERSGGRSLWKQEKLYGRHVTAPTVYNGSVAVADFEGVVHLLSTEDGSFKARQTTDKSAINVAPRVIGSNLVVQTAEGGVFAFSAK